MYIRDYDKVIDFLSVKALYERVFRETFPYLNSKEIDFLKDTKDEYIKVAIIDGVIVGFISIYKDDSYDFIHHLFIDTIYRKKGVGSSLVDSVKRGKSLTLKCCAKNISALSFYKKIGFKALHSGFNKGHKYLFMKL